MKHDPDLYSRIQNSFEQLEKSSLLFGFKTAIVLFNVISQKQTAFFNLFDEKNLNLIFWVFISLNDEKLLVT